MKISEPQSTQSFMIPFLENHLLDFKECSLNANVPISTSNQVKLLIKIYHHIKALKTLLTTPPQLWGGRGSD